MINSVKARTSILALILFVFGIGYTFAANKVVVIPMAADAPPQSFAVFASGDQGRSINSNALAVRSVSLTPPVNGVVIVNSNVVASETTAGDGVDCSITETLDVESSHLQQWISPGSPGDRAQLAGTRGYNVIAGAIYIFSLRCKHTGTATTSLIRDSSLTAIFTPSA